MAVSEKVRKQVKARSGGACQLFHREYYYGDDSNPMEIIHKDHQGFGGQASENWKNQPDNLLYGCRRCHNMLHHPTMARIITEMEPDRVIEVEGEQVYSPVLKIVEHDGTPIPDGQLWLHAMLTKQKLGVLLAAVRGDRMFEGDRAKGMMELYDDYDLLEPNAASPEQMLASEGFDSEVAIKQVQAARWIEEHHLEWPRGVIVSKVLKFKSAPQKRLWEICNAHDVQAMLNAAVNLSKSDINENLVKLGIRMVQPRVYMILWPCGEASIARISDLEKLQDKIKGRMSPITDAPSKINPMIVEIQKFVSGFELKRGKLQFQLRDVRGQEVPFWTDEDLEQEKLPGISWFGGERR